ncbi:hypothetical protein CTEN210_01101 [Chaetoceros tenuissimus]|uniref:Uncharacterized protein n=1 Tax=Chaetoceros tenuissimus TaxID=426638 RepID=A0AAD3GZ07_9STRA|nr:hypothetical protein CTEN210_01101 [Chaetoceros tenuissimus]
MRMLSKVISIDESPLLSTRSSSSSRNVEGNDHDVASNNNSGLLSREEEENFIQSPWKDCILIFVASIGCTIPYTSVLSNLVFYTQTIGVKSYLILNIAIYGPMLPITILQTIWDGKFDSSYGSYNTYFFRGNIGFLLSLICLLMMPFISHLMGLSIVAFFMGLASSVLHGMLKQMASFIYPGCGRLAASVAAGMQASALPTLAISLWTGFGRCESKDGIFAFYFYIAVILVLCWICFQVLITKCLGVRKGMERHDSLLSFHDESQTNLLSEDETDQNNGMEETTDVSLDEDLYEALTMKQLWKKSRVAVMIIIMTVASSMTVAGWLNRVQSENPTNQAFPQVLFYVRLFGDLLGRPATLYYAPSSLSSHLKLATSIRLLFLPLFFVYVNTNFLPKKDIAAIFGIFAFAFSSGYLVTCSYQLAPLLLDNEERGRNLTKQNGLINVCFSFSILLGFALTFAIGLV